MPLQKAHELKADGMNILPYNRIVQMLLFGGMEPIARSLSRIVEVMAAHFRGAVLQARPQDLEVS